MRPSIGSLALHSRPIVSIDAALPSVDRGVSRRRFLWCAAGLFASFQLSAQTRPLRIVSTAPSITEALFALDLGNRVVGVSRYCNYPPQVVSLPKVGSYIKPDLEAIARLTPDLVLLQAAQGDLTGRLTALGIAYAEVPHGTLEDVFSGIEVIAKSAGVPERATAVVNRIRNSLQNIQAKSRGLPSPRVVAILDRRQGTLEDLTAVGPDNYVNQILEIAGAANVLAKPGLPRYPHISLETILREDPDMILDLSSTQDSEAARQAARPAVLALWQQNGTLQAVRKGHVYFGTSNVLLVPGPRAPEAAEMLFDYMHGAEQHG